MNDTFADWYESRYRRLLGAVAVAVGDLDSARDATDEAFCRALAKWQRVSAMDAPEAWTYRVAINVHKRRMRRRALEERLLPRLTLAPNVAYGSDDADLWKLVAGLPPRQRAAIALRYVADMTETDIAAALGVSRGTVASNLHDARHALHALLREPAATEELHHG